MSNLKLYKTADEFLADMPEGEREAIKLLVAEIMDTDRAESAWRSLTEIMDCSTPPTGTTLKSIVCAAEMLGIDAADVDCWVGMTAYEIASGVRYYEERKKFNQSLIYRRRPLNA